MKDEVRNKTGVQKVSINPDHIIWTPYRTEYIRSWEFKTYKRGRKEAKAKRQYKEVKRGEEKKKQEKKNQLNHTNAVISHILS